MSVNTEAIKKEFAPVQKGVNYPVDFPFEASEHLKVTLTFNDGTTQQLTEGQDYTVTKTGDTGYVKLLNDPPANSKSVIVKRYFDNFYQTTELANGGVIDAEVLEDSLDTLDEYIIQLKDKQSRALVYPENEDISQIETNLPSKSARQGTDGSGSVFGFDSNGKPIIVANKSSMQYDLEQMKNYYEQTKQKASEASMSASESAGSAIEAKGYADDAEETADDLHAWAEGRKLVCYSSTFGDGTSTEYVINHNLETTNLLFQLFGNSGTVPFYTAERIDNNNLKLVFEEPVATNSIDITITSAGYGEGGTGKVKDVKVDGVSVLDASGVANIDNKQNKVYHQSAEPSTAVTGDMWLTDETGGGGGTWGTITGDINAQTDLINKFNTKQNKVYHQNTEPVGAVANDVWLSDEQAGSTITDVKVDGTSVVDGSGVAHINGKQADILSTITGSAGQVLKRNATNDALVFADAGTGDVKDVLTSKDGTTYTSVVDSTDKKARISFKDIKHTFHQDLEPALAEAGDIWVIDEEGHELYTLDDLNDVVINAVQNEQLLVYKNGFWRNSTNIDDSVNVGLNKTWSVTKIVDTIHEFSPTFRGLFDTYAALMAYTGAKNINDRAVVSLDETRGGSSTAYSYNGVEWKYEYSINPYTFTPEQMAAINSGINAVKVAKYDLYEEHIEGKVDKTESASQVYATTNAGTQTTIPYSGAKSSNSLALRDNAGRIRVGDPTLNEHAASKKYTDQQDDKRVLKSTDSANTVYAHINDAEENLAIDKNRTADTVAWRGTNGVLKVGEPVNDDDAVTKLYATTELDKKVDKTTSAWQTYATNGSGVQTTVTYSEAASGGSLAKRDGAGRLRVGTPTDINNATTKKYVDDLTTLDNVTLERDSNIVKVKAGGIEVGHMKSDAVSTVIPDTGAVDTKLATEKAVYDFATVSALVDDVTIEKNTDKKLQNKEHGLEVRHLKTDAVSTAIPDTGSVDTKLATEKAVAEFAVSASLVDDITIEKNTDKKLQVKAGGIEVSHMKSDAVSTSIPATGAVDTKLATEKAVSDKTLVDDTTIERDTDSKLQVKDKSITLAKLADQATTEADKMFTVTSDGSIGLSNNYLPLTGGTMTGTIQTTQEIALRASTSSQTLRIQGGTANNTGPSLNFWGSTASSNAGLFILRACDGTNTKDFQGNPDGTLKWDGKNVTLHDSDVYTAQTRATMFARGVSKGIKYFTSVKFTAAESPSGSNSHEYCVEIYRETNANNGYMRATYEANMYMCYVNAGVYTEWQTLPIGNYLPLSGGTLTGTLKVASYDNSIVGTDDSSYYRLCGGTNYSNGANISLFGKTQTSYPGVFRLIATNGTNTSTMLGYPSGSLYWNGVSIVTNTTGDSRYLKLSGGTMSAAFSMNGYKITSVGTPTANTDAANKSYVDTGLSGKASTSHTHSTYLPLTGGTISGTITSSTANPLKRSVDTSHIEIYGGTSYNNGAFLKLYGKSSNSGMFELFANNGTTSTILKGVAGGDLTWGGNKVHTGSLYVHHIKFKQSGSENKVVSVMVFSTSSTSISSNNALAAYLYNNGFTSASNAHVATGGWQESASKSWMVHAIYATSTTSIYVYANNGGRFTEAWTIDDVYDKVFQLY